MPLPLVGMVIGVTCLNTAALIIPANRLIVRLALPPYSAIYLLIPLIGPSIFIYLAAFGSRSRKLADYKLDHRRFKTKPVEIIDNK